MSEQQPTSDPLSEGEVEALVESGATSTEAAKPPAAPTEPKPEASSDVGDPQADIEVLLNQAEAALASVDQPEQTVIDAKPFNLVEFGGAAPSTERTSLELLRDVELDVKIELGRSQMQLEDVLKLRKGSVVSLDKLAGDPVDIFVNGRLVARGEVLVLNENFCVRVAELMTGEKVSQAS